MRVEGKYTQDDDFVTIYAENALYILDKGTLEFESRKVGDELTSGEILTQEFFDQQKNLCENEGIFIFDDGEEYDEEEEDD